jgi:hypothetical protein
VRKRARRQVAAPVHRYASCIRGAVRDAAMHAVLTVRLIHVRAADHPVLQSRKSRQGFGDRSSA